LRRFVVDWANAGGTAGVWMCMKYEMVVTARKRTDRGALDRYPEVDGPAVEELGPVAAPIGPGGRRWAAVLVLLGGVVAVAVAGGLWEQPGRAPTTASVQASFAPRPPATPPTPATSVDVAETAAGLRVTGRVPPGPGSIHLAVLVRGRELARATQGAERGTIDVAIPLLRPPFTTEGELVVTRESRQGSSELVRRPLRISPGETVGILALHRVPGTAGDELFVGGFAPATVRSLEVRIADGDGHPLGAASTRPNGDAAGWGGLLLDHVAFEARVPAPDLRPGEVVLIELEWRCERGMHRLRRLLVVPPEGAGQGAYDGFSTTGAP
jgi:hypothetical protein